jgi:redox-sensitive bicupin YhaK (pirin superfamily)
MRSSAADLAGEHGRELTLVLKFRRSGDRGKADHGWLKSQFTFSFADYYDPEQMGFRALRVINDDHIAAGQGFGPHAHRDMEILTYVLEGKVLHRDSTGNRYVLRPNEIQMMSAGSGIVHSEFNASQTEELHLFQIWIFPDTEDLKPGYQQIAFDPAEKRERLRLLAAPSGHAMSGGEPMAIIHQNARVYVAELAPKENVSYMLAPGRYAWVQLMTGNIMFNGQRMLEGDGVAIDNERELFISGDEPSGGEFLLFDLP